MHDSKNQVAVSGFKVKPLQFLHDPSHELDQLRACQSVPSSTPIAKLN